jgi:hypothetical protein
MRDHPRGDFLAGLVSLAMGGGELGAKGCEFVLVDHRDCPLLHSHD